MDDMVGAEWYAWREHPKTKEFVALLETQVKEMQEEWLSGSWVSSDGHQATANSLRNLGGAQAFWTMAQAIKDIRIDNDKEHGNG